MDTDRFDINSGRTRPEYKAKEIRCPHCDAQLHQKDECSEMIVCAYCNMHIDLSQEEKTVLGQGRSAEFAFPIAIGDSFQWDKVRFEVIARMVFIEDDDITELTRQYLLYNPRRGTLWLSEYENSYSLTKDSHISPEMDPFALDEDDTFYTHNSKSWTIDEIGELELIYVDGALPWKAQIGDCIEYIECSNQNEIYEVQRIHGEVEYGNGRNLKRKEVEAALGKPLVTENQATVSPPTKRFNKIINCFIGVILAANVILWAAADSFDKKIFEQKFVANESSGEFLTEPFTVKEGGDLIRINYNADLSNAWMNIDAAVVTKDEVAVHVFNKGLTFYSGTSGGESWSEGSRQDSSLINVPNGGEYQILFKVSSGTESKSRTDIAFPLYVSVHANAHDASFHATIMKLCIGAFIALFLIRAFWGKEDE